MCIRDREYFARTRQEYFATQVQECMPMPISLIKIGVTTTIQEYFAEHYTRIQNDLKMIPE